MLLKPPVAAALVALRAALLAGACLIAAGCGDRDNTAAGAVAGTASLKTAAKGAKPGLDADLVKAASPSKSGANIEMRFKLAARPEAGKPVGLTLVFEPPNEDIERMTVSLQASDGLSIESGEGPAIFVPSHGAPITHEMSVKAGNDGIYSITAAVLLESMNNTTASRSFSVPVIVGHGIQATEK